MLQRLKDLIDQIIIKLKTIPTKVSELENDEEYAKEEDLAVVAFTGRYQDLLNLPANLDVWGDYDTIASLLDDQPNQSNQKIYYVEDATDDPNLSFDPSETKRQAFYRFEGVASGQIEDYTLIAAPYGNQTEAPTGLEAIDEGNGIGWRLKGRNPDNYGNIGLGAIDLGDSDTVTGLIGARGEHSTVGGGLNNKASGSRSTVGGGQENEASGTGSTVGGGTRNEASNIHSTVGGGIYNEASGRYSTVSGGVQNIAKAFGEFLGGLYSTIKEGSAITWIGTDRIFGIGNGKSSAERSDAFNVYKNGVAELPSVTNALIDASGGKTIPTKEWVQEQAKNPQLKITANATVLANWNRHTVFLDGTNLEISVNVSTNELDENTEIYFYNMSDSEADFKFTAVGGWSLPDDATLEPNSTCILMRVLDEQKLILIGNE